MVAGQPWPAAQRRTGMRRLSCGARNAAQRQGKKVVAPLPGEQASLQIGPLRGRVVRLAPRKGLATAMPLRIGPGKRLLHT